MNKRDATKLIRETIRELEARGCADLTGGVLRRTDDGQGWEIEIDGGFGDLQIGCDHGTVWPSTTPATLADNLMDAVL